MRSEFKTLENTSTKKKLFTSTADAIGYRQEVLNSLSDMKLILKEYSQNDNSMPVTNAVGVKSEPDLLKKIDLSVVSNSQEIRINSAQSAVSVNRVDQVTPQPQGSTNIVTPLNYRA